MKYVKYVLLVLGFTLSPLIFGIVWVTISVMRRQTFGAIMTFPQWIATGVLVSILPFIFSPSVDNALAIPLRLIGWVMVVCLCWPIGKLLRSKFPPAENYVTGDCSYCGQQIEFPERGIGDLIQCPHCGQETLLTVLPENEVMR